MIKGVILVGVGRNLNRAIRTCYSFGIYDVFCLNCSGKVEGNLFSASKQVGIHIIDSLDQFDINNILALEVHSSLPNLDEVAQRNSRVKYVAIGGETTTLKRHDFPIMARIPTDNSLCLTTEAALAIALYELRRS